MQTAFAKSLLHAGANPDAETRGELLLTWCITRKEVALAELLIDSEADPNYRDERGSTPLIHSAREGLTEITRKLLAAGADPNIINKQNTIALFSAQSSYRSNREVVEMLLPVTDMHIQLEGGWNALHRAILSYDRPHGPKALDWVLKAGVDLEAKCGHHTPLTHAIEAQAYGAIQALIDAGCDVNAKWGQGGRTVLNYAATTNFYVRDPDGEMVALLIKGGADVDGAKNADMSPLESAIYSKNTLAIRELVQGNCDCKIQRFENNYHGLRFMQLCDEDPNDVDLSEYTAFILVESSSAEEQLHYYDRYPKYSEKIGISAPPISLVRMCRLVLRSSLPKGAAFLTAVDQLPLPRTLRDFIALRPV